MEISCSKHYEVELYWEQYWGFGFWIMRGWFGVQCFSLKIVVSKKCEPIEPIEYPKLPRGLCSIDELRVLMANKHCEK